MRKSYLKSEIFLGVSVLVENLWYDYTCCEADVAEEKYFDNFKTLNSDMSYLNLLKQPLNARDFNALSGFNLQLPENLMFNSGKVSVLRGETSPYFPSVNVCVPSGQANAAPSPPSVPSAPANAAPSPPSVKAIPTVGSTTQTSTTTTIKSSKFGNNMFVLMRSSSESNFRKSEEKSLIGNESSGSTQSRTYLGKLVYINGV